MQKLPSCKNTKLCNNCYKHIHTNLENSEKCNSTPFCIICSEKGLPARSHNPRSKRSNNKVFRRKAESMLQSRTPNSAQQSNTTTTTINNNNNTNNNANDNVNGNGTRPSISSRQRNQQQVRSMIQ